ncbi:KH domain-containing protein HEN4 isoform X2 [Jatropha curcas]|uniref:KH domain-containing protein HEN4 isoform X2 n=1 Tax=Jatropha curcas TaxID=180498 RepID=UPI0005FBA1A9|nr:KH domain-containing protein HEN4 isoform X2 [Jatropha curcas]XP_020537892.1 KH domain-containing protein HEN4 isoform X2 [Jatropha curcas]XP_020537893.1 KH domain-containing protein HEN4 isoform X2 [Jatropha curcas]
MGSTFLSPPLKRTIHYSTITAGMPDPNSINGTSNKRSKPLAPSPLPVPPGHVSFRLLCHASRIGGVIGKSGSIIKQLQQDTGAKIRIEEAPVESPDRVITVIASSTVVSKVAVSNDGSGRQEIDVSKAQEALVRVFERILTVAAESDGIGVAGGVVSCRLLAEAKQVGSVIGKGGKIVEKIREDCGVKIRVLTDKLPVCAGSTEEMVEIEGDVLAVKRALVAVSRCLQDCQLLDKTRMISSKPAETVPLEPVPEIRVDVHSQSQRSLVLPAMPSSTLSYASGAHPLSLETHQVPSLDVKLPEQVVFKILCSSEKVGGVIGKGGTIIKALQNETGASITIGPTLPECDERLITVTAAENPQSRYSAAQKTVVLVFSRSIEAGIEKGLDSSSSKGPVTARLVVPSNQVGCLLGKGGTIVSEMRKTTGTGIKILGGDQVPKCAQENDQVVQISGELPNVKDAIYHITGRLRDNLFSSVLTAPGTRNASVITETSPYIRLREPLRDTFRDPLREAGMDPLREAGRDLIRDTLGNPLRDPLRGALKEHFRGPTPLNLHSSVGFSHNLIRHTALTHSMDHLGLSRSINRPPSPRLWASQTVAGANPRGITDVNRGLSSFKGGVELGSGSKSAIVTNTTVEIVVPENVIGSVYGENGSNLTRLRQKYRTGENWISLSTCHHPAFKQSISCQ